MNLELCNKALQLGWQLEFESGDYAGPGYVLLPPKDTPYIGWAAEWRQWIRDDGQLVFYPNWAERVIREMEERASE